MGARETIGSVTNQPTAVSVEHVHQLHEHTNVSASGSHTCAGSALVLCVRPAASIATSAFITLGRKFLETRVAFCAMCVSQTTELGITDVTLD